MAAHFTIGKKLALGVAPLTLSVLVLSYASLRAISRLATSLDTAVNQTARELAAIGTTQEAFQELRQELVRQQIGYAMTQLERTARRAWPRCANYVAARRGGSRVALQRSAAVSPLLRTVATAWQSRRVVRQRDGLAARGAEAARVLSEFRAHGLTTQGLPSRSGPTRTPLSEAHGILVPNRVRCD